MKTLVTSALAALTILVAGNAFAATATQTIKSIDQAKHAVTLSDGQVYTFPASYDLKAAKVGEKVQVTYENKAGMHEASMLKAAK